MGCFRSVALFAVMTALAPAQGIPNRPKASEYPAHVKLDTASVGAEYLVRSFSGKRTTYTATDHLVVEIGFFPDRELMVSSGHFTLRLNGKKQVLFTQPPQFVAAALKWDDWENRRSLEADVSAGDRSIGVGPRWEPRFPGDNRRRRLPAPPRAPEENPAGEAIEPSEKADEVVVRTALTEGPTAYPVAGFLYFPYRGKPKSIKSVELIYHGPAGSATVKLM